MQGLADTFILLGMPFDSDAATQLNKEIFECIYFSALETSNELAQAEGRTLTKHCRYCMIYKASCARMKPTFMQQEDRFCLHCPIQPFLA